MFTDGGLVQRGRVRWKLPSSEIFLIFEWGKIKRGDIGSTLNIRLDIDPLLNNLNWDVFFIFIVEEGNVKVTTDAPVATTTTTTTTTPPPQRRKREVGK